MNKFLLFLDTETSDVPPSLDTPVDQVELWPKILQISWCIYTWEGKLIKNENYFIYDPSTQISPKVENIHHLNQEELKFTGLRRKVVMLKIKKDLKQFDPLIVGHFVAFDLKMLEVGFYRSGLKLKIDNLPRFCTMHSSSAYNRLINNRHPKLGDLYFSLFAEKLTHEHNSFYDVQATASCFFKLLEKGSINKKSIYTQTTELGKLHAKRPNRGCLPFVLIFSTIIFFALT